MTQRRASRLGQSEGLPFIVSESIGKALFRKTQRKKKKIRISMFSGNPEV
jgi:hypothetical protein